MSLLIDTEGTRLTIAGDDRGVRHPTWRDRLPGVVAMGVGAVLAVLGIWAMAGPASFFDAVATFDPYNQHFIQDIGAFQVGLGAVLVLAAGPVRHAGLAAALLGVGIGTALHAVSHVVGRDLGGTPETDIPTFVILALVLLAAGVIELRRARADRSGPS